MSIIAGYPMGKSVLVALLLALNAFLALGLVRGRSGAEVGVIPEVRSASVVEMRATNVPAGNVATNGFEKVTPFAVVYSTRPTEFVANLRQAGCPEETVRDILKAEIGRRYRHLEQDLRPTPGDHLPRGWSTRTHEAKIVDRRQRAAAIVREKESLLRQALGYDVTVPMPAYAMTVSDQRFNEMLSGLSQEKRNAAHLANEQYWTMVEQLRARTKGFWESEDVEELNRLKAERQRLLNVLEEVP